MSRGPTVPHWVRSKLVAGLICGPREGLPCVETMPSYEVRDNRYGVRGGEHQCDGGDDGGATEVAASM